MVKFGEANKNVHKEVKKMAKQLESLVEVVATELQHERILRLQAEEDFKRYRESQKTKPETTGRQPKTDIRTMAVENYEDFVSVRDKEWVEESFAVTSLETKNPLKEDAENIVLFCDEDPSRQIRWKKQIEARYPEIREGEKTICDGGSYTVVEQTVRYGTKACFKTKVKSAIVVFHDPTKEEYQNQRDIYQLMSNIREAVTNAKTTEITQRVAMTLPQGISNDQMRKMTEVIFRHTDVHITINVPQKLGGNVNRNKGTRNEALLIQGDANTYAETLRTLKEKITEKEAIQEIRNIRKTLGGNMILTLNEGAKVIHGLVENVMSGKKVRVIKGGRTKIVQHKRH